MQDKETLSQTTKKKLSLEEISRFCKQKGFVYESSEIYGGLSGVYDFGPMGTLLYNNIKAAWQKAMVQEEDNIVALDAAILRDQKCGWLVDTWVVFLIHWLSVKIVIHAVVLII